jgi:enamine deaminase RidA (YjgF/YER057c/UK114 family)
MLLSPLAFLLAAGFFGAPEPKYVTDAKTGDTLAVVVPDVPLVHTGQMSAGDAAAALDKVEEAIRATGGDPKRIIKLNVGAVSLEAAGAARETIRKRYPAESRPAVSMVVGKLPDPGASVAIDAVAIGSKQIDPTAQAAVLPAGPRTYISGQAEKGATPAEAAAKTIASLVKTLEFLGAKPGDAVQAKCFLKPISAAGEVAKEFDRVFGPGKLPLVFVEWESTLPIEIELIARCPAGPAEQRPVEYLTPPGMTASPVYARVTRVQSPQVIYAAGLVSPKPGTGAEEVAGVFEELNGILGQTGSDLKHLAKATYYVSGDDASKKLNELRPKYYDPKRPPAASKAQVPGVGTKDRTLTLDMIAVPKG